MAFGNVNNDNVNNISLTGGQSTPVVTTPSSQSNNFIILNLEEMLRLYNLQMGTNITPEQYQRMSADEQNRIQNQYNRIRTDGEILGWTFTRTTTEPSVTTEPTVSEPTVVTEPTLPTQPTITEPTVISEDTTPTEPTTLTEPEILLADRWHFISVEDRRKYLLDQFQIPKEIMDLPRGREERKQAIDEALNNLAIAWVKESRGIDDARWDSYSDTTKQHLLEKARADIRIMVEKGLTQDEVRKLSYSQKLQLEIEIGDDFIESLNNRIDQLAEENKQLQKELASLLRETFGTLNTGEVSLEEYRNIEVIEEEVEEDDSDLNATILSLIENDPKFRAQVEQYMAENPEYAAHIEQIKQQVQTNNNRINNITNNINNSSANTNRQKELNDILQLGTFHTQLDGAAMALVKDGEVLSTDHYIEYLETKLKTQELTTHEKGMLSFTKHLRGLGVHEIKNKGAFSLSNVEGLEALDWDGDVLVENEHNAKLICDYIRALGDPEAIDNVLKSLGFDEGATVWLIINGKYNTLTQDEFDRLIPKTKEFIAANYTQGSNSTVAAQKYTTDTKDFFTQNGEFSKEDLENYFNITSTYFSPDAQVYSGARAAESNNTLEVALFNKANASRDDHMKISDDVDAYVYNSNTINDDIKKFYAQNSIEVLTDENERNVRANNLRSYNNDLFNSGVEIGLQNVANGANSNTSTTSTNSTTSNNSGSASSYTNSYGATMSAAEYAQAVAVINSTNYESAEGIQTVVETINENPNLLSNINNEPDRIKVIEEFCSRSESQDILKLIKNGK